MVRINLLPWRQRRQHRDRRAFLALLLGVFVVAVALVAAFEIHLHGRIESQRESNRLLERRSAELDAEIAAVDLLNRRTEAIEDRLQVLQALWSRRSTTVEIFDQLARSIAAGTHLVALSRRGDALAVRGTAESNDQVSALMRELRDAPAFAAPNLKNIGGEVDDHGESAAHFELTFTVAPNAAASNIQQETASP